MNQFKSTKYIMITAGLLLCLFFCKQFFSKTTGSIVALDHSISNPIKN